MNGGQGFLAVTLEFTGKHTTVMGCIAPNVSVAKLTDPGLHLCVRLSPGYGVFILSDIDPQGCSGEAVWRGHMLLPTLPWEYYLPSTLYG